MAALTGDTCRLPDDPLPLEESERDGAKRRLEKLYRAHAPRLLRLFSRRAGSHEAPDLVQESFARLADAQAFQDGEIDRPEAYLSQIARNLLRNRARSALQRSLTVQEPADKSIGIGTDLVAALEARDHLNRVQIALIRLKPQTRAIFLANRIDGFSYKEIAAQTGLSVKGVEWHMSKAIAHIDRSLKARS
jgi:RNA polymerase sigma-70 factor (ECF subfamily)